MTDEYILEVNDDGASQFLPVNHLSYIAQHPVISSNILPSTSLDRNSIERSTPMKSVVTSINNTDQSYDYNSPNSPNINYQDNNNNDVNMNMNSSYSNSPLLNYESKNEELLLISPEKLSFESETEIRENILKLLSKEKFIIDENLLEQQVSLF